MTRLLLGLLSLVGGGQDPVHEVRIVVHSDGTPLPAVTITIGATSAVTDSLGQLTWSLPAGSHRILAEKEGYAPAAVRVEVPLPSGSVVRIAMESLSELEEIVVVGATRTDRRIEDEPTRVEVLTREEIEEKLLMTPGDITMLLNESGGLRVQSASPSLGSATLRIQGLRGRYTRMLIDGLPLAGAQTGSLGMLQIPPMDLGQVEVVKGIASALHGGAALGGVVNLVSRAPEGQEVLANVTTLGGVDVVGWTGGPIGSWRGSLLTGVHLQERQDRDGDGWTDVPGYRRVVARPRAHWNDESGREVYLTLGLTAESREGGTLPGGTDPDGLPYPEELTSTRIDGGLTARLPMGSAVTRAKLAVTGQFHDQLLGEVRERDRHQTLFAELTTLFPAPAGTFLVGGVVEVDRFRSEDVSQFDYTYAIPGLLAQYDWQPADPIALTASVRLDHHSRYGTFLNPRLAAFARLGGPWTLRASGGTGFFGPTPFVEETESIGLSRLLPFDGVVAERAVGGSVDLGGAFGAVEVNATLFGSRLTEAVSLIEAPAGQVQLLNASGPTQTTGAEALARYRAGALHLTMTYTWLRATELVPGDSVRRTVPLNPRHALGMVALYEQHGRMRLGAEFFVTGEQQLDDNPYREVTPTYLVMGLFAERRFGPVRAFLNLENLLDTRQTGYDPLVRPTPGLGGRWTVDLWAPGEGRVINGGIRIGG